MSKILFLLPSFIVAAKQPRVRPEYHPNFAEPDADLILSSNDGTRFRVAPITMKKASGYFRATLTGTPSRLTHAASSGLQEKERSSTPQPTSNSMKHESDSDSEAEVVIPADVVTLSEPKRVIENMLGIICGIGIDVPTALRSVEDVADLLFAAEKYELPGVFAFLRIVVVTERFLAEEPLRVYALACRYRWDAEAELALPLTLSLDVWQPSHRSVLDRLTLSDMTRIFLLRRQRTDRLRRDLNDLETSDQLWRCNGHTVDFRVCRPLKLLVLNEIVDSPSGESIKAPDFVDHNEARTVILLKCKECGDYPLLRNRLYERIVSAVDNLPRSLDTL